MTARDRSTAGAVVGTLPVGAMAWLPVDPDVAADVRGWTPAAVASIARAVGEAAAALGAGSGGGAGSASPSAPVCVGHAPSPIPPLSTGSARD